MAVITAARAAEAVRSARRSIPLGVLAAAVFVLTAGLRLVGVGRSSDLFVDEVIYRDLGISAANGGFPRTDEGLFFLHPPGFFYLQAAWGEIFGLNTDVVTGVYEVRVLNALLAGGTAVLLLLLVARARSRTAGAVAVVLFALDPYCIRQNNRAMLETETMFWVLAGYLVLLPLVLRPPSKTARSRALCAGLLFGLAVLTKDHSALITILPLFLALFLGWGPPRRLLLIALGACVGAYTLYTVIVAAAGHFGAFWEAKTHGFNRLIGMVQETGFNAQDKPSLAQRLGGELLTFGSTYVLLALGPIALVLLLRHKDPVHRFLALFQLSAAFTLLYALVAGTLEEQALYLLVVPNLVALAVAFPGWRREHATQERRFARRGTLLGVGAAVVLAAAVTFSGVSYANVRLQTDDGYAQLRHYMAQHVPAGSTVAAADGKTTRGITGWVLKDKYRVGSWVTPGARAGANVRYVVIPWKIVKDGYGRLSEREARLLAGQGSLLFSTHGSMYGTLALYELPLPHTAATADRTWPGHGD
ncbi:phospholipid carrier-dependent glycosyltransferase [Streptomyces sp. NPDC005408]|uniref:ArnT family glycosyltransferase n=1 Tax=Streptomyces sp. NPDC005408 TaxID=3155341 RepID=UPI0033B2D048